MKKKYKSVRFFGISLRSTRSTSFRASYDGRIEGKTGKRIGGFAANPPPKLF
ncbi:MAG: hypothetical protein LBG45_11140 [Dysgonamonadaceae bacterium]|nr:hypothetical protein [Dysgonamonadaceae bacterium]